jgi:Domain of unknown function (DUF1841)
MMQHYDPLREPAAEEWLEMAELDRIALVESYHRNAGTRVPNLPVHATLHVIVENQAALGDETPVRKTLARLMKEPIDRHEAIHAVASVLIGHISDIVTGSASDPNAPYNAALEKLTVRSWRKDNDISSPPRRSNRFRR